MLSESTSPAYLRMLGIHFAFNVVCLLLLNSWKKQNNTEEKTCKLSLPWPRKQFVYYACMLLGWVSGAYMDYVWNATPTMITFRVFLHIFLLGLLDFAFADTKYLSPRVIPGTSIYFASVVLSQHMVEWTIPGTAPMVVVSKFDFESIYLELCRFIGAMGFVAIMIDLIFSPLHRIMHTKAFSHIHKEHHNYKHSLTSLLLFYADELDDIVMAIGVVLGYYIYAVCVGYPFGWADRCWSNITLQAFWYGTMFSHTHDVRCARLIVPFLPDSLNFAEYHRSHHMNPSCNFGLTYPSDFFWDWITGVNTIKLEKISEARQANKAR